MKKKILNLYAGIGGNRKLWGDEYEVTAVEYKPEIAKVYQDLFPLDQVIVGDAHQYLIEHYAEFDFIWSSPPCPTHSRARYGLGFHGGKVEGVYPDMRLYQEILFLKHHFKGKYCVENVQAYYKPLIEPQILGRHWYWANFRIEKIPTSSSGITTSISSAGNPVKKFNVADWEKKYDYDLSKYKISNKRLLLRNCVEPEVGLHILNSSELPHVI
jgi:DNA (cytosine-5)-methyltransferase 1